MNPVDVIVGQYARTILELQARLAQAACEVTQLTEDNAKLRQELEDGKSLTESPVA